VGVFFAAAEGVEDAVDELLPPEWLQAPTMTKNTNTPPTSHGHFFFGSIRSTATGLLLPGSGTLSVADMTVLRPSDLAGDFSLNRSTGVVSNTIC
jgi:hypothetical protein